MSISPQAILSEDVAMEQTAKTAPAPGRPLATVTTLRPLDRNRDLHGVRRERRRIDRFSAAALAEREVRFAHLKRSYD